MKHFAIVCGAQVIPDYFETADEAWSYCYALLRRNVIESFMVYKVPQAIPYNDAYHREIRIKEITDIGILMKNMNYHMTGQNFDDMLECDGFEFSTFKRTINEQYEAYQKTQKVKAL